MLSAAVERAEDAFAAVHEAALTSTSVRLALVTGTASTPGAASNLTPFAATMRNTLVPGTTRTPRAVRVGATASTTVREASSASTNGAPWAVGNITTSPAPVTDTVMSCTLGTLFAAKATAASSAAMGNTQVNAAPVPAPCTFHAAFVRAAASASMRLALAGRSNGAFVAPWVIAASSASVSNTEHC